MKIPLGGGAYLEPDGGPRDTIFHRRIVRAEKIRGYDAAYYIWLDCGHRVIGFGNPDSADGVALCVYCRDSAN